MRTLPLLVTSWTLAALCSAAEPLPTRWNVLDAGAVGDGAGDCTAAFQKTLDAAGKAGGGIVEVPAGRFRISTSLAIPANVTLQGIYRSAPTPGPASAPTGSVLLAFAGRGSQEGTPFIRLAGNNASIAGLVVVYPEWKQSDVPPVPYPPCVYSENTENTAILDCCFLNPYEAIKLVRAARHLVRNITGYPIRRGLFVDECYDIGRVENVHFWPFGVAYDAENPYCKWVNTQGVAFEFARTDWHYVHNTFCFGYGVGYKFSRSKQGSCNGNFLGLGADSCQRAVLVQDAQPPGLLISNGEFVGRWSSSDSVCLEVGPECQGKVSLVNCSFWGPIDRCVWMRAPDGQFTASACHFVDWDNGAIGSPAIALEAGKAIIQGCTFNRSKLHVAVSSNALSAIITGNQAEGGFRANNFAGKRAQIALNETNPVEWENGAALAYQVRVGHRGDGRFVEGWHDPERVDRFWRWSGQKSRLLLPVTPGKKYWCELELSVPEQAMDPGAGIYFRGNQLVPLKPGAATTRLEVPASTDDSVVLELRCRGWVPKQVVSGSQDPRVLGVQLFRISMRADGAGERVFDANNGRFGP